MTMDSPFLTNKPLDEDDGTLVLADLSIADEESFDVPSSSRGLGLGRPPAASTSASSSAASSSSRPFPVAPPSTNRPPSKPRFSLFAPGISEVTPAHTSTLRTGARPLDPPSERSERSQPSQSERPPRSDRRPPTFGWDEAVAEEPEPEQNRSEEQPREEPQSAEARDEALRSSLDELKRINTVFDTLMGVLEEGRAHNTVRSLMRSYVGAAQADPQRLATRVAQTSALLDDYVKLLGQAEHTRQLVMNEKWTGAEDVSFSCLAETDDRTLPHCKKKRTGRRSELLRRKRDGRLKPKRQRGGSARDKRRQSARPLLRPAAQRLLGVDPACDRRGALRGDEAAPSQLRREAGRRAQPAPPAERRAGTRAPQAGLGGPPRAWGGATPTSRAAGTGDDLCIILVLLTS